MSDEHDTAEYIAGAQLAAVVQIFIDLTAAEAVLQSCEDAVCDFDWCEARKMGRLALAAWEKTP